VLPGEDLRISLKYQPALFDAGQIGALGQRLRALLRRFADRPDAPLAGLDPLLPGETSSFAADAAPEQVDVVESIALAAARWPDREALTFEDRRLTYAELDARANQLAWALRERGAGPERVVGIAARRGVELIVALLATLRVGAAYLPLDPDQPAARLRAMLDEANPVIVLGTSDVLGALPRAAGKALALDDPAEGLARAAHRPATGCTSTRPTRPTSSTPPAPPAGPRARC